MRKASAALGLVIAATALAACSNKLSGSAKGNLKEGGELTMSPTDCYSGERQQFFGVQLEDSKSGNKVRIVKPATSGYQVLVGVPKTDKMVTLTEADCKKFDVSVEKQNSTINNIANVAGRLSVDCKAGEDTFSADVTFANCH